MSVSSRDMGKDGRLSCVLNILSHKNILSDKVSSDDDDYFEDVESVKLLTRSGLVKQIQFMLGSIPVSEDTYISDSTETQHDTSLSVEQTYRDLTIVQGYSVIKGTLLVQIHSKFIDKSLRVPYAYPYKVLDANHGWLLYWLLNSRSILDDEPISDNTQFLVTDKIDRMIIDDGKGGIAGGSNQIGHLGSSYASILSLALVEDYETMSKVRGNMYQWLMELKNVDGSFSIQEYGETDCRSTYCALVIASLLNIVTDELTKNTLSWISKCQSYEGGFAGFPGTEAHGGYTYCALASLFLLLGKTKNFKQSMCDLIDLDRLIYWVTSRQHKVEGGLSGRTNKLVDACYGFWIGACYPMIECILGVSDIFDRASLQVYLLHCAQSGHGGFRDKPGKSVDFYHTNYALCGVSICEHQYELNYEMILGRESDSYAYAVSSKAEDGSLPSPVHPVFGVSIHKARKCKAYFSSKDKEICC